MRAIVRVQAFLLLVAGCADDLRVGREASDSGVPDSGDVRADSADAGSSETDAGPSEPTDAGTSDSPDASAEPVDAGLPETDAGPADSADGGSNEGDGGADGGATADAGCADCAADEPIPIEGYGRTARGGWQPGHDVVHVTSLDDDGPGTLRESLRTGGAPRIVRFALDGTIALGSALLVPSNTTVDGRGRSVVLAGKGLIVAGTDDVILTHLTVENVLPASEDGLRVGDPSDRSDRVAVDHVTFRHTDGKGDSKFVDEALSVVWGATDVTVQWCLFESWEKVLLISNGDAPDAMDADMRVTVHHCRAHGTGRRHPQARLGTFDFYDNFWDGWHMYGWYWEPPWRDSFGMLCERNCRLRAENNLFLRVPDVHDMLSRADDATACDTGGVIDESGSSVAAGSTAPLRFQAGCPAGASVPRPYEASVEPADEALRARLEAGAGNVP